MNQDHQDHSPPDGAPNGSAPQDLNDAPTVLEKGILDNVSNGLSQDPNKEQQENLQRLLEGKFQIESFLGRGACAAVYLVTNLNLDRKEALKVMAETQDSPKDFSDRFKQEAKISASLEHPNIVQVYDFGQTPYGFCYTMQYVVGHTLSHTLRKDGVWDQERVAKLALPLLDALDYSHSKGVIHRDIKPSNVLLDSQGTPFLTDFGIAKTMGSLLKTRTGKFLGTPIYVAPEQISAQELDGRADLYALGVTLYELLTQNYPFPFKDPVQVVMSRLVTAPRPPSEICPDIDPAFEAIILRALEKNPKDRFESASEMYEAIVRFLRKDPADNRPIVRRRDRLRPGGKKAAISTPATAPDQAPPHTSIPAAPGKRARRTWGWVAAASVVAILVTAAGLNFLKRSKTQAEPPPREAGAAIESPIDLGSTPSSGPEHAEPAVTPEVKDEASQEPKESKSEVTKTLPKNPENSITAPNPAAHAEKEPQPTAPVKKQPAPKPIQRRIPVQPPQLATTVQHEISQNLAATCQGEIISISLVIDENGQVVKARILSSGHPDGCAEIIKDAAMNYTYDPALDANGDPIQATIAVAIEI